MVIVSEWCRFSHFHKVGRIWSGEAKPLEKLEKDGVPKDPRFNTAEVASWWQDKLYSGQAGIARSEP
jgi:hypothetical protein